MFPQVAGLSLKFRENCLEMIRKSLEKNLQAHTGFAAVYVLHSLPPSLSLSPFLSLSSLSLSFFCPFSSHFSLSFQQSLWLFLLPPFNYYLSLPLSILLLSRMFLSAIFSLLTNYLLCTGMSLIPYHLSLSMNVSHRAHKKKCTNL